MTSSVNPDNPRGVTGTKRRTPPPSETAEEIARQPMTEEEELRAFIEENWKRIGGTLLVVVLCVLLVGKFRDVAEEKRGDASARFSNIQANFAGLLESIDNKTEANSEGEGDEIARHSRGLTDTISVLKGYV